VFHTLFVSAQLGPTGIPFRLSVYTFMPQDTREKEGEPDREETGLRCSSMALAVGTSPEAHGESEASTQK